jgi:hypothetical protein
MQRRLAPGRPEKIALRLPLSCPRGEVGDPPPVTELSIRPVDPAARRAAGPTGTIRVVAGPVGRLGSSDGLCAFGDSQLPTGWRLPTPGTLVRSTPSALVVDVDVPPGLGEYLYAPGTPLIASLLVRPRGDGTPRSLRLTLTPAVDCGVRFGSAALPTTIPLAFAEPGARARETAVQVGPALAAWLLARWDESCPSLGPG